VAKRGFATHKLVVLGGSLLSLAPTELGVGVDGRSASG
jgi:hypothetical protein